MTESRNNAEFSDCKTEWLNYGSLRGSNCAIKGGCRKGKESQVEGGPKQKKQKKKKPQTNQNLVQRRDPNDKQRKDTLGPIKAIFAYETTLDLTFVSSGDDHRTAKAASGAHLLSIRYSDRSQTGQVALRRSGADKGVGDKAPGFQTAVACSGGGKREGGGFFANCHHDSQNRTDREGNSRGTIIGRRRGRQSKGAPGLQLGKDQYLPTLAEGMRLTFRGLPAGRAR